MQKSITAKHGHCRFKLCDIKAASWSWSSFIEEAAFPLGIPGQPRNGWFTKQRQMGTSEEECRQRRVNHP